MILKQLSLSKISKAIILNFLLFILSFTSKAGHIAGGDMDVQWVSGNSYKVTLKLFRDCANGGANFDQLFDMNLSVYVNGTNTFVKTFQMTSFVQKDLVLGDTCFAPPSSVCMQEGTYTATITLNNNSNGYYITWERCCRSPLNLNVSDNNGMLIYAQVPNPTLQNSSPKFSGYPLNGYFCVNTLNAFDFSATDANGDSLAYSIITPYSEGDASIGSIIFSQPGKRPFNNINWLGGYNINNIVGGTPNMSINRSTGVVTCTPTSQGAFTFAVLVEEYRNGVKIGEIIRDIQLFSIICNKDVAAITQTLNSDNTALEGCIRASFTFTLDKVQTSSRRIDYEIKGNAINGVDYNYLEDHITIPAGQTSATIYIDAKADGITEGIEDIYLLYYPIPCNTLITDTVFLYIDDNQAITYNLTPTDLTCNGNNTGTVDLNITGGLSPFTITLTDTITKVTNTYSSTLLPITGLAAGTYSVKVDDKYGCGGEAEIVGAMFDAGQTFLPDGNGQIFTSTLPISGISTPTITSADQIQSICLNIEHSSLGDLAIRLKSPDGKTIVLKERFSGVDGGHTDLGEPVAKNQTDGGNASNVTPGIGYDYCFNATPTYGTMVGEHTNYSHTYTDLEGNVLNDNYLPAGSYLSYDALANLVGSPVNGNWIIEVEDYRPQSNGYIFNWSISFKVDKAGDIITINEPAPIGVAGGVTSASCNGTDGAINITPSGTTNPYTFSWSNGAVTEDISGLAANSYTVTVTDKNNCTTQQTYIVPNATGPGISAVITDEKCAGNNNGSINTTLTGTITNISWSNGSSAEDISGLAPNTYIITVTDNSGCKSIESFTINAATPIAITNSTILDETCGNKEGAIDISVAGGTGTYTYTWNNGKTTEDLTDLQQGTYTVTIKDANNCSFQRSYSVVNSVGNCTPVCDLAITSETVIDETCGNSNGSINITTYTSNAPSTISWSNGANGSSITNLSAGDYTATIGDPLGCSIKKTYTVINNAGSLTITNPVITNENCGNKNGAIDISVSGGVSGYTFAWSNGASSEDLTGIGQGNYTVTVTDNAGCKTSQSYTVSNQAGNMSLSTEIVKNETCGNKKGSISISVSPSGTYSYKWSNGATTQSITNLAAGTYSCTITQTSTGCKLFTQTYTVLNSSGTLSASLFDKDDEVCGNANGEIDITVSGASTYTYNWSNGANTQDLTGLPAGNYSCTVTDNIGCTAIITPITIVNTAGTLDVSATASGEQCGNGQGNINLTVMGGTSPYTISWSNGSSNEDLTTIVSGYYTYTVTDFKGCVSSSTVFVSNNTAGNLNIDNQVIVDEVCGNGTGQIDITVSGISGSPTYSWSNGAGTEDITGVSAGNYSCTITDGSGCSITTPMFTVNNTAGSLTISSAVVTDAKCSNSNGAINITVGGGSGTYTYTWSNGAGTQDISGVASGNYSCLIDDGNGCVTNYSGTVADVKPKVDGAFVNNDMCDSFSGYIDLTVTGGLFPYTYSWSNGETTEDIFFLGAGTYTCTIKDANNCSITTNQTVINTAPFYVSDTIITNATCPTCANGSINITIATGGPFPNIFWDNGAWTEDINNLLPGTYTLYLDDGWMCFVQYVFIVGVGTGINSYAANDVYFNLFPNPTSGVFTLKYLNPTLEENSKVIITDILGKLIREINFSKKLSEEIRIDLTSFDSGVYYIKFIQGDKTKTQKLILSK